MSAAPHDEHDDHGHTVAAWFLTVSWTVAWTVSGVAVILGQTGAVGWTNGGVVLWASIALGASVVLAAIAGVMKKVGLGRKTVRPIPQTREEWQAARDAAVALVTPAEKKTERKTADAPAPVAAPAAAPVTADANA